MKTYNQYLTEVAQEQSNNGAITIYKVRRPLPGEVVIGYSKLAEALVKPTYTEECELKDDDDWK